MDKKCVVCGKTFSVKGKRKETAKYCSRECASIGQSQKVALKCDFCGKEILVKRSKAEAHEHHFCSLACLGKWNGKQREKRVVKTCVICGKEYSVKEGESSNSVTCSNECQHEWQRQYRVKENASNWHGGGGVLKCLHCGKEFKVRRYLFLNKSAKFCSQKCKQEYWATHVITKDGFKKARHIGNMRMLSTSKGRETSLEKHIRLFLERNGIKHDCQHVINNKFCVDFFLEDSNVIIEALGDYWHGNPLKYSEDSLNRIQLKNKHMDKARFAYLRKCGYIVFDIWENEVNTDINKAMQPIIDYIGTLTTDISGTSSEA